MKKQTIKLGKAKKERVQWGFNPSPKVVPNKKKKAQKKKVKYDGHEMDGSNWIFHDL